MMPVAGQAIPPELVGHSTGAGRKAERAAEGTDSTKAEIVAMTQHLRVFSG